MAFVGSISLQVVGCPPSSSRYGGGVWVYVPLAALGTTDCVVSVQSVHIVRISITKTKERMVNNFWLNTNIL